MGSLPQLYTSAFESASHAFLTIMSSQYPKLITKLYSKYPDQKQDFGNRKVTQKQLPKLYLSFEKCYKTSVHDGPGFWEN